MAEKRFWQSRNLRRVLLFILLFLVIAFLGSILFTLGLGFRKRTLLLRLAYMIIAVVWVVGSIGWICYRFGFGEAWKRLMDEIYQRQESFETELAKKYQALLSRFPMAVAQYEAKCWKKDPRPTHVEIMDNALRISVEEWELNEAAARQKMRDKRETKKMKKK